MKDAIDLDVEIDVFVDMENLMRQRKIPNLQSKEFETISNQDEEDIKMKAFQKSIICFGGVLLTNEDGHIILNNTLDARCELCFEESLPDIREMLGLNDISMKD